MHFMNWNYPLHTIPKNLKGGGNCNPPFPYISALQNNTHTHTYTTHILHIYYISTQTHKQGVKTS